MKTVFATAVSPHIEIESTSDSERNDENSMSDSGCISEHSISLYDENNISQCPWPNTKEGEYAKEYLRPIISKGVNRFIDNIDVKMAVLIVGNQAIPVTVNDKEENSGVCSPYSYYVMNAYALLKKMETGFFRMCFKRFLDCYARLMQIGKIHKVVNVNNWLLSSSPFLRLDSETVSRITRFLQDRFPDYAIIFSSVNQESSRELQCALRSNRYRFMVSKCIYVIDGADDAITKTRIWKSDRKFFNESSLRTIENIDLSRGDAGALRNLYRSLYIQKYSSSSPDYNTEFFELLLKTKALEIVAVSDGNEIKGVAGYLLREGRMISPLFGYDPLQRDETNMYRYLSVYLLHQAVKNRAVFNQSSGGAFFKKLRRAQPRLDYTAFECRHLSFFRRIFWIVLSFLMNTVGRRAMEKY